MRVRGAVFLSLLVWTGSVAAQVATIVNGGFEQGLTGWGKTGSFHVNFRVTPNSGKGAAAIGVTGLMAPDPRAEGTLVQSVQLPVTPSYRLTFMVSIATAETSAVATDTLAVEILSGLTPQATPLTLSNLNKSTGYIRQTVPLDAYAGRTVRIQFRSRSNTTKATTFLLDDVALEPVQAPTILRGRVRNAATGAGVKAEVSFLGAPATISSDGSYVLSNIPCQTGRLLASASGLQPFDEPFTPRCGTTNQKDIDLKPPATTLTGRMRDIPTGAPLAEILVNRSGGAPQKTATDGSYVFTNIPCAATTLSVNAKGYKPWRQDVLPTCGSNTNVDIPLDPELTALLGNVTDAGSGRRIAGASVNLGTTQTRTDEAGLFALAPIVCATSRLMVSAPGYQSFARDVSLACAVTNIESVTLVPNLTTVSGRVTHEVSGLPLAATVSLESRSINTTSTRDYTLTANCGRTVLKVTANGYRPRELYYTPQCGTANTMNFKLVPLPTGTSVCGTVRNAPATDVIGIEGVTVTLNTRSDITDPYGTYCLASIPCPNAKVPMTASKPGYRDSLKKSETVTCGALTTIDFLMLEQHFEGTVTEASSGIPPSPIAGAKLTLGNDSAISGLKGTYRFRKVCRSDDLKVTAEGYQPATVKIKPDCSSIEPTAHVSLQPNATNVMVRLSDGLKGVDKNLLVFWGDQPGRPAGDGWYAFPNVLCQIAPLTVYSMRYAPLRTPVKATCNTSSRHAFGLTPVKTMFFGTIRDGINGGDLSGAMVRWGGASVVTEAGGGYRMENAPCGKGTLSISKSGYATKDIDVTVPCAQEQNRIETITLGR